MCAFHESESQHKQVCLQLQKSQIYIKGKLEDRQKIKNKIFTTEKVIFISMANIIKLFTDKLGYSEFTFPYLINVHGYINSNTASPLSFL